MEKSDQELIDACRQGDGQAWDIVLNKYERLVFSIPLNYGLTNEDAADVTQITFTILIQSLDSLRHNTRLAPWLATVARRHTWRLLERRRREHVGVNQDLSESLYAATDDKSLRHIERWEVVEWLEQGFTRLDERCKTLLIALYFEPERPTYEEVAQRLEIPVGSIGPVRARCLARLRQMLQG